MRSAIVLISLCTTLAACTGNAVKISAGGASSAPVVFATDATAIGNASATYPLYMDVARINAETSLPVAASLSANVGSNPTDTSLTLNTKVDGKARSIIFAQSEMDRHNDMLLATTQAEGINYVLLLAGFDTLRHVNYGAWSQEEKGGTRQSNELFATFYGGRETPLSNTPDTRSFSNYIGTTVGSLIRPGSNSAVLNGNLYLSIDFTKLIFEGIVTDLLSGPDPLGATIQLKGTVSDNGLTAELTVIDKASKPIGKGQFNAQFFGPKAEEIAGKWSYSAHDGSQAIGAFGGSSH